jgi:hypothetical protein
MVELIAIGIIGIMVMLAGVWITLLTRLNYKLYTEFFKQIAMSNRGKKDGS